MIFDSHAHYTDERFDSDRDELLSSLPSSGVGAVFLPGSSFEDSLAAVRLAGRYGHVWAGAGIHPHGAAESPPDELEKIEELLANAAAHRIVAVGECGLDYHYDFSPRDTQKDCFDAQIALSVKYGLPLIIHDREAHADTLDLLRAHPGARGVFHCYSGSAEMVNIVVKMGFYVSFSGSVTFKNAHRLRDAARAVPAKRLLVETDAPYLSPEPARGRRNDSRMIRHILAVLAETRGVTTGELEELTWVNAHEFFGIGPG